MKKMFLLFIITMAITLVACDDEVDINGAKVNYDELQKKIDDVQNDITEKKDELKGLNSEIEDNEDIFSTIKEFEDNKKESKAELDSINEKIQERLKKQTSLEDEIDSLEGNIIKTKDEPIELQPGTYYFGKDIDVGRYKVMNQDGYDGNVYFNGDGGFAETFGSGEYSIPEYTFTATDGDDIQLDIPSILYRVQ